LSAGKIQTTLRQRLVSFCSVELKVHAIYCTPIKWVW
jgi:hypothetical protein